MLSNGIFISGRVKIKESEKIEKYLDFAWELKDLRNIPVKLIPIVVGSLGILPKDLAKRQKRMEFIESS